MGKQRQKHRGKRGLKPDVAAMKTYHPGDGDGLKHLLSKYIYIYSMKKSIINDKILSAESQNHHRKLHHFH